MKKIAEHIRGYQTPAHRKLAVQRLQELGFNYFVCFRDVQSENALLFGRAPWVPEGSMHVNR